MIHLGEQVYDSITGFSGVVIARFEYLYGCVRVQVQSKELKDGKPVEPQVFDEAQLIRMEAEANISVAAASTGGPRDAPPGRAVPRR